MAALIVALKVPARSVSASRFPSWLPVRFPTGTSKSLRGYIYLLKVTAELQLLSNSRRYSIIILLLCKHDLMQQYWQCTRLLFIHYFSFFYHYLKTFAAQSALPSLTVPPAFWQQQSLCRLSLILKRGCPFNQTRVSLPVCYCFWKQCQKCLNASWTVSKTDIFSPSDRG